MDESFVIKVKAFADTHLKEEFSLNDLAKAVGYSAFHLAREFKQQTGVSIMDYVREKRILSSAQELDAGLSVCDTAMEYCFDTHAGFTKAFTSVFGCTPKEYQEHSQKMKTIERNIIIMDSTQIKIRHVCRDDVQDLWENVYSAMTPRQITEDKIEPAIKDYESGTGLLLVAEVDGKVVMSLAMSKPSWIPLGFVWDNNFNLTGGDEDIIMQKLVEGMRYHAKQLSITTLISPQNKNTEESKAMQSFGFKKVFESGEWEYLMMAI
ncbi:MAG: AraC family transcriptional regulator [Eubacteriales bacterium]|nr:AraC family transcriptional regulator [Eubacteriales bacterium]MDD4422008.1 AraC family transcriptional regulator [Eubacteriales bacterium]